MTIQKRYKNLLRQVCNKYGICNATITNIVKCEEEIKSDCLKRDKKRNRDCEYAELEKY